ncbi:MAG TPA: rhomboid family intramembrane serine protease, partial [Myxococcota bacterium]|nr:rhomboid family intramembrane serine protease [Myxococcota bacterium]
MLLLTTRDNWWTTQTEAMLEAAGIEGSWVLTHGVAELSVADADGDRVAELLGEQLGEELRRRKATERDLTPRSPLFLQPAFAAAVCSAVTLLVVHTTVNKSDAWFKLGIMVPEAVRHGEWWRLVTAATLHADANHVLHNAAFLVLLGW